MLAVQAIFADDTPVAMLAPGTGKTQTARLWAYGRDERPWGSAIPAIAHTLNEPAKLNSVDPQVGGAAGPLRPGLIHRR